MDITEYTLETLERYIARLKALGYENYNRVYNLLFLIIIQEMLDNDFRGFITETDYLLIDMTLQKEFGTSPLLPFPEYVKGGNMNYTGSISELAYRVNVNEQQVADLTDKALIAKVNVVEDVNDIVVP